MEFIGKKYKMVSSENLDAFMKAMGVGMIIRTAAKAVNPVVELCRDGDGYNFVSTTSYATTDTKFKPGVEFEEERADGAKVKSVCTFDGSNVLRHVQKGTDGVEVTYIRTFGPDEMKAEMTAKGVTCIRIYKAQ